MPAKFSKEELLVEEWFRKAQDDELIAQSILKHRDAPPSGVCFVSQQMAEKYLKAFLVKTRGKFPKVHVLEYLLTLSVEIDQSFEQLKKEVALLDTFYTPTRYPGDYLELSWKDAEEAFKAAIHIKEFVSEKLLTKKPD